MMKKQLLILLASLSIACTAAGTALSLPATQKADAGDSDVIKFDFTDTMDGASFKAPESNYGWKVSKGVLTPDNTLTENNQIGYLEQGIALNEQKYISLDFYTEACPLDIMLLPYAETVDPWVKTGVGLHCMESGWIRLDNYIDANDQWYGDYTGIGNGVDWLAHRLEIFSNGTNLTFKIDGVDAFTGSTVAIPADTVQLLFRAPKWSYIDNLYIGTEKPTEVSDVVDIDFSNSLSRGDFSSDALNGWQYNNGAFHPSQDGVTYNADAVRYCHPIDLTGTKYISLDFYTEGGQFDVALLDQNAENIWGNSLTIHIPNSEGNLSVTQNIDVGNWLGGVASNLADGNAHFLEIFVDNGKVSYKIDGETPVLDTGATEFDAPSQVAYLVFRAVSAQSYIDNLYIADSAPTDVDVDFETASDGNAFTAWNSTGWTVVDSGYRASVNWATTQLKEKLDLTKNQKITFDVFLSSGDTDKQFNIAFVSEENLATASTVGAGVGFSLGSTLWLGTNLGRGGWIADAAANLYNHAWHSVTISVLDGNMTIAVDGVAYDALTTAIPADSAYMLLQSTSTENLFDNLKITVEESESAPVITKYTVTFKNYDDSVLQSDEVEENTLPVYAGETPTKEATAQYSYVFKGWDKEIEAVTGDTVYTAVFDEIVNTYTVTWKNENGVTLETDENVEYGATPEYNGETPVKVADAEYTYEFKGWDKEIATVTGDVTYTAQYTATPIPEEEVYYTVTFQNWNGDVLQSGPVQEGSVPVYTEEAPTRAATAQYSYVFKGWDKELSEVTGDVTYTAVFDETVNTYTVTWQNENGAVLETDENVEYGATPEYNGETPVKATDGDYTYEFKGWDKEIATVTGDVTYTAQYTATVIIPEYIDTLDLDFSDAAHASEFAAYGGSSGWSVVDGVYKPNAAWASVHSINILDLTKDQQITFDVYLSSSEASNIHRQFNFGFFETKNVDTNNQVGSGVNYSLGATLFYGSSFSRVNWVADVAATLYDDSVHSVKITVKDGKLSIAVDGTAYDTLTTDIPAESVYLLMQSTSTETYVDNFKIGEIEAEPIPEPNPYDGVFEKYGSGQGWGYKDGKYSPNAAWSVVNSVEKLDFTENKEISFDVYLSSADKDKQFNVGFFETKVEETNVNVGTGLTFAFGSTIWVSTNFGRVGWASECVKDYFTDGVHSVKITVIDKQITLTVDGEVLYFLTNGEAFTPTLTVDSAYLLLQGTSTETYIQNYQVNVAVAPPKAYLVTFQNWDGSVLQSGSVEEGSVPVYAGATPVREPDTEYTYEFKGWDKEISAVTGDVVYVAQFTATEIPDDAQYYTVTFQNWDGSVLQSDTILEGLTPEYKGETPTKAPDKEYVYTFSGWDKEISAVTGDTVYVAQFTATEIPKVEVLDEAEFDFEDETITDNVTALANGGWAVKDGKYYPSVEGALHNSAAFRLNKAIDLTGTKYISLDFYSTAKTFDIGLLDTMAENMWGNAQFIHLPFADGTIGLNTYVDCTAGVYLGGSSINVMDGAYHNLKIVVDGGKISYVLDGVEILSGFDAPSAYGYLVIRAVGEESYIDNLVISNEDIEYIPPVIDNSYDELELDFTAELDGTKYFQTYDSNGWAVKDGVFSPEYMPWAATYLKQPVDMSGEKYISLDFLAIKNNGDETQSQFNFVFFTDLKKSTASAAIHCFVKDNKPVIVVNRAMGEDKWIATCDFDWADGQYHNLMIIIKDKTVTFEIDGEVVKDNVLGNPVVVELKDEHLSAETYFGLQATNVMSRIDNFNIKNTYTEYVAPTPEEEITFDDYENSFVNGEETDFVAFSDSYAWIVNSDGKLTASQNWSKVYLDKEIPLTSEKTVALNVNLTEQVSGHQFTVGFSTDKNSYYGLYLVFYQDGVTLNYGTAPQVRVIGSVSNKWYDGKDHQLKFIVKNNKAAVLIDGEVLFKDIQVAMNTGYFTLQSSTTQDCVDDLSIINYAEPLSKPNPDNDIATKPGVSTPATSETTTGKTKLNGVWLGLAIAFGVLTAGLAGVFVFLLAKKKK